MARYRVSVPTTATTQNAALAVLRATTTRLRLLAVQVTQRAGTQQDVALAAVTNPQATGPTTSVTPPNLVPEDKTSDALVDTAWTTPPAIGGAYIARDTLAGVVGNGVLWSFDRPVEIPINGSVAVWNPMGANASPANVTFYFED